MQVEMSKFHSYLNFMSKFPHDYLNRSEDEELNLQKSIFYFSDYSTHHIIYTV